MLKDYLLDVMQQHEHGLYMCELPTGNGKTYDSARAMKEYADSIGDDTKIIYLTTLNKNLPEDALRVAYGSEELYKRSVLRLRSNFDEVVEKILEIEVPEEMKTDAYLKLCKDVSLYRNAVEKRYADKEYIKELADRITEGDRQLRYEITKRLKHRFSTKTQRKKAIRNDSKYKWIGKLYPAVFTDDYKIILMSVSKFMKRNSILIDASYEFLKSDLIEKAIIFIDEFDATKYTLEYEKLSVMDKWLLSKLNSAIKAVDEDLANYKIPEAAKALQSFVDDMSNWYVRRSRERFWAKGMEQDKINAYMTLYTALVTVAKAAAPMIPFMTEDIYQNLVRSIDANAPESIHLCDYPKVNEAWIDKDLEANMEELLEIVVLGRACRNTANIKNRQPIGTMYVKAEKKMDKFYTDIIADELNVKEVKFADDVESFISYSFKPQLRTVGPKYGKLLNGIRTALSEIDGTAAMKELRENGVLTLDIDGNKVELAEEDLLIETAQTEGYVTETDGETSVVLDTNLTPELIQEGFVREIISKVQTMRKEAGFEVMDKIIVYAKDNDKIMDIMKANQDEIKREVLAENIILGEAEGYTKEWNINKEAVTLGVSKVQEEN